MALCNTEQRSELGNDTVCPFSRCKLNFDGRPYDFKPDKDQIKAEKSATNLYNQTHSQE